jgi:hypothetical protein
MMAHNPAFYGRAYDALRSALGRQACAEGWGIPFFDFVAEQGRKPAEGDEQDQCRAIAARVAAAKPKWPRVAREAHDRKIARFERIANGSE